MVNNGRDDPVASVKDLTGGLGADVAIEAVGVPATFELCTELVRPGGHVANIGVHGSRPRSTSKRCGFVTSPSRPGWLTPTRPRPCSAWSQLVRSMRVSSAPTIFAWTT